MTERIFDFKDEIRSWRRHIHQHPELAFHEHATADFVADKLTSFGIEIHRGLAGTGVVGTIRTGTSNRAIGLRADMDALPITEANEFAHASHHNGVMHACGHDGHTAMLLGAARYLAETKNFNGTVHLIFQPAEEAAGGARVMIEDGLFEKFPVESVYGMHNMPGIPTNHFAMRKGTLMAAFDSFDITITGIGAHAALPHTGRDPVVAAAAIITALQTIVSREINPTDSGVVSITRLRGGETYNVIPNDVQISGCCRALDEPTQARIIASIKRVVENVAAAHNVRAEVTLLEHYPPTVSTDEGISASAAAAIDIVGADMVDTNTTPLLGSEDFGYMLQAKPGSYIFIGNGPGSGGCILHNPHYDFNDDVLVTGARYWARLVERELPR